MKSPFFARFLESQKMDQVEAEKVSGGWPHDVTHKWPSDDDEPATMKYPSDNDEGLPS